MKQPTRATKWDVHFLSCKTCKSVDINNTASLVNVCNRGAPLLRDQLALIASKSRKRIRAEPAPDFIEGKPVIRAKGLEFVVREKFVVTEIDKKTEKPVEVEKYKTISPKYPAHERAKEFLDLAIRTMGGDSSRFFIAQK